MCGVNGIDISKWEPADDEASVERRRKAGGIVQMRSVLLVAISLRNFLRFFFQGGRSYDRSSVDGFLGHAAPREDPGSVSVSLCD